MGNASEHWSRTRRTESRSATFLGRRARLQFLLVLPIVMLDGATVLQIPVLRLFLWICSSCYYGSGLFVVPLLTRSSLREPSAETAKINKRDDTSYNTNNNNTNNQLSPFIKMHFLKSKEKFFNLKKNNVVFFRDNHYSVLKIVNHKNITIIYASKFYDSIDNKKIIYLSQY